MLLWYIATIVNLLRRLNTLYSNMHVHNLLSLYSGLFYLTRITHIKKYLVSLVFLIQQPNVQQLFSSKLYISVQLLNHLTLEHEGPAKLNISNSWLLFEKLSFFITSKAAVLHDLNFNTNFIASWENLHIQLVDGTSHVCSATVGDKPKHL